MKGAIIDRLIGGTAKRAALIIAIMWVPYLAALMFLAYGTLDQYGNDFVVYWDTANWPVSFAYAPHERSPFPYMPTMLLWIKPLALIPKAPAFVGWVVVSSFVFTWANRKYLTAGQNLLALASKPIVFCLLTGQVSVFLAAVTLWAFGTERKWLAGTALGAIASIKPQLLLLAPLLLFLRRDFEMITAAVGSFVLVILVSLLTFGIQPWLDWWGSLEHFRAVLNNFNVLRAAVSPASWAEHLGYPPLPFVIFGAAFGSWLVYRCRNLGPVEVTAAVTMGSIFASPYALLYDMAAIVPFLVLTVWNNRLLSSVALAGKFLPLPIFLAAYELLRTVKYEVQSGSDRPDGLIAAVSSARNG